MAAKIIYSQKHKQFFLPINNHYLWEWQIDCKPIL